MADEANVDESKLDESSGESGSPTSIYLPADCRLAAQQALKVEFLQVPVAAAAVLDGTAVERIDTAALQLLLLFRREREACGGSFSWSGASQVLHEAASLLGVARILELPAAEPA